MANIRNKNSFFAFFMIVLALSLFLPLSVIAEQKTLKILAVSDRADGKQEGNIASLSLDIKPGSGRIFIDLQPASKLDTQFSTKFANRIACSYLDEDCSKYDFLYTIKANSAIISGPSASSAVTLITIAALKDVDYPDSTSITGTINSGYLIGPVGGVKAKIEAAANAKLRKVLIPKGERYFTEKDNTTTDLIKLGNDLGLEIVEVGTLDEVSNEFFGKILIKKKEDISIDGKYSSIMKNLSDILCIRSIDLSNQIKNLSDYNLSESDMKKLSFAENLSTQADDASKQEYYYARASYCYGANVQYNSVILGAKNNSRLMLVNLAKDLDLLNSEIDNRSISTINDLQAYMVVKERILDSREYIENAIRLESINSEFNHQASAALERYYSALAWSSFFDIGGKEYILDKSVLRDSCVEKLSEVEEIYQYLQLYSQDPLVNFRSKLNDVHAKFNNEDYALCLYGAITVKAEIDSVLSPLGFAEKDIDDLYHRKLKAAKDVIADQQQKGIFPIIGYSYYEYAQSLYEKDKYSALLYLEYALEISNIDIYFTKQDSFRINSYLYDEKLLVFLIGLVIGVLLVLTLNVRLYQKKRRFKRLVRIRQKR